MGGMAVDWLKMKTEYITTDISYRGLAEKYGVSKSQIYKVGGDEGWVELRERYRSKAVAKSVEKIAEKKARQVAKVGDLADKLLIKLEKAIDELDLKVTTHKVKVEEGNKETTTEYKVAEEGGIVDRVGLRQLTGALRELQAIKGEITDLERREKEARIDALRRSSMTSDGEDDDTGVILLASRLEADSDG